MQDEDFGETLEVIKFQRGLEALNSGFHFDMGANLGIWHPKIHKWMGVYHNGRHLCSMDRGPMIPEYNVYALERSDRDGTIVRGRCLRIGWRTTMERIVRKQIEGVTWDRLCLMFGVDKKHYKDHATELEVA